MRHLVVAAAVGLYVGLGFLFRLGADTYLILGIPITVAFQRLVSRRPLQAIWVRDAPPFRLNREAWLIAALLAGVPLLHVVTGVRDSAWGTAVYGVVGTGGAVAAAYAIRAMRRTTVRQLGLCLATAGAIGIALNVLVTLASDELNYHALIARASGITGIESFLFYLPITFVVEEVFFRGTLDSYLHHPDEGTGWLSAVYLSSLWGLWHTPIYVPEEGARVIPSLLWFQIALGVPLSIWWRRSGNLTVTGTTHALVDAVRNTLAG